MMENHRIDNLVKIAVVEARIRRHLVSEGRKMLAPSKLLSKVQTPRKGVKIPLSRQERSDFITLIRDMRSAKKTIEKYRERYSRRPRLFYRKVFGFPPREQQSVRILWGSYIIHFVFKKNDLISFWKRVKWGPGSGGFYPLGDRDIKIRELRGLISFGREEELSMETRDILMHESTHAFDDFVKKRRHPQNARQLLFFNIKSELNAYLHNIKSCDNKKRSEINDCALAGYTWQVRDLVNNYLSYEHTLKRMENLKARIRKEKTKKRKIALKDKLSSLRKRMQEKRKRRSLIVSLHNKSVRQIRYALNSMPVEVVHRLICDTRYDKIHQRMPLYVKAYRRLRKSWYNG